MVLCACIFESVCDTYVGADGRMYGLVCACQYMWCLATAAIRTVDALRSECLHVLHGSVHYTQRAIVIMFIHWHNIAEITPCWCTTCTQWMQREGGRTTLSITHCTWSPLAVTALLPVAFLHRNLPSICTRPLWGTRYTLRFILAHALTTPLNWLSATPNVLVYYSSPCMHPSLYVMM